MSCVLISRNRTPFTQPTWAGECWRSTKSTCASVRSAWRSRTSKGYWSSALTRTSTALGYLGDRKVRIRTDVNAINIDCSQTLPSRDQLTNVFVGIMVPIMEIIGERRAHRFFYELADGATHSIGGADINRDGVWLAGSWKFLWWQAKPRFVPWSDIKIWSDEGKLHLACNSDLRLQREIDINTTENALVLDRMIRVLFTGENLSAFKSWRPQ